MMYRLTLFILSLSLFLGCSSHQDIQKEIDENINIHIYTTKVDTIFEKKRHSRDLLKRFPFISIQKEMDVRGKFSQEFYDRINAIYVAKNIEDVDFWRLEKEPKSVDFIYVLPLWIKEYRKVSGDILENICYSLNISKKEQDILRAWVAQGGKLWLESGTFSTKYDVFNARGEIATHKIASLIKNSLHGVDFWGYPLKIYTFKSKNLDPINYLPTSETFQIDTNRSIFKDITRLKLDIDNYMQSHFVIAAKPLVVTKKGLPVVTLLHYKKGYVLSMLPFEYKDVYYDGELLRWELLFYLLHTK